jgi:hypothetical protein
MVVLKIQKRSYSMLRRQGTILMAVMILVGYFSKSDIQIRYLSSSGDINCKYNFRGSDTISKRTNIDSVSISKKIQTELKSSPNRKEKIKFKVY